MIDSGRASREPASELFQGPESGRDRLGDMLEARSEVPELVIHCSSSSSPLSSLFPNQAQPNKKKHFFESSESHHQLLQSLNINIHQSR